MVRAGFGIRLGAAAIDAVAMYISSSLVSAGFIGYLMLSQRTGPAGPPVTPTTFVGMFAVTGLVWMAYSLTEVVGAATPAKRLLKLRVGGLDHERAAARRRLARWAVKYGPMLVYMAAATLMYMWVLNPNGRQGRPPVFMMALNLLAALLSLVVFAGFFLTLRPQRQALHDLIAGTVVLRPGEAAQGFTPLMPVSGGAAMTADPAAPPLPEARGFSNHG
jgi:uncharacterized RDD family membrane protein YckC